MNVTLSPKISRLIRERVKSGRYGSAEDVISAAVQNFAQWEALDNFEPRQLQALLDEGERDIKKGDVFEGKQVFDEIRKRSAQRRGRTR